jgi:hypothetical protein
MVAFHAERWSGPTSANRQGQNTALFEQFSSSNVLNYDRSFIVFDFICFRPFGLAWWYWLSMTGIFLAFAIG